MSKKPGRRVSEREVTPKEHPLHRINAWKATSAWYQSFGGEANYRKEMIKRMDRERGVGSIIYAVERAIEERFPTATESDWRDLAELIVREVIHPVQEENGVWRIYPIRYADRHFGPRESELRWERRITNAHEEGGVDNQTGEVMQ